MRLPWRVAWLPWRPAVTAGHSFFFTRIACTCVWPRSHHMQGMLMSCAGRTEVLGQRLQPPFCPTQPAIHTVTLSALSSDAPTDGLTSSMSHALSDFIASPLRPTPSQMSLFWSAEVEHSKGSHGVICGKLGIPAGEWHPSRADESLHRHSDWSVALELQQPSWSCTPGGRHTVLLWQSSCQCMTDRITCTL